MREQINKDSVEFRHIPPGVISGAPGVGYRVPVLDHN